MKHKSLNHKANKETKITEKIQMVRIWHTHIIKAIGYPESIHFLLDIELYKLKPVSYQDYFELVYKVQMNIWISQQTNIVNQTIIMKVRSTWKNEPLNTTLKFPFSSSLPFHSFSLLPALDLSTTLTILDMLLLDMLLSDMLLSDMLLSDILLLDMLLSHMETLVFPKLSLVTVHMPLPASAQSKMFQL